MAMQVFRGGLWGGMPGFMNNNPAFANTLLMDSASEKVCVRFQVPKTGTLDKVEFRTNSVTFGGGSALRVSFQDLAVDGNPDGAQDQYRDVTGLTANTWIVPGLMTHTGEDGGNKRPVTQGQFLSVVFEYQTFTASDSIQIASINKLTYASPPQPKLFTGISWTEPSVNLMPVMALKYSDGSYENVPGCVACSALNSVSFNSASPPDERGLYFQTPFPTRIRGAFMWVDPAASGRDFDILLYAQGNNTPLATLNVDSDAVGNFNNLRGGMYLFPSSVSLSANTNYRLTVRPSTVNSITLQEFDVASAAIMDTFEGGQNWHHTSRTDGATTGGTLNDGWTQTTTKRPWISPLFDQFDDGVGGGSTSNGQRPMLVGAHFIGGDY